MEEFKEVDCVSTNIPPISSQSPSLVMEQHIEKPTISPCHSVAINSLTINGGDGHIGNNYITVNKTENLILNVTSLEDDINSAEAQIIKSIQTNLESELSEMKACDEHMSLISKVVVSASVLIIIVATVFAATIANHQPRNTNLSKLNLSDDASYCNGICFVNRQEWGTKWVPPKGSSYCVPLNATIVKVKLWFSVCVNIEQCSKEIRGVEARLSLNLSSPQIHSIKSNFVIGGDERYYIGRAWDCGWENFLRTDIIFNNYTFAISERQTYLFQLLIHTGRKCGFINRKFKFFFDCGLYCYTFMDFGRIANMTRQDLFLVRDYQTFLNDSRTVSKYECENSSYSCKIKDKGPNSMIIVGCSF